MYLVRLYGYDPLAGPDALLEEADFTSGLDVMAYIAGQAGTGRRAELLAWVPVALRGRRIIGYDDKGFPCLGSDCPECGAVALIINEWDATECLSCSWREFGPDDDRADYSNWPDESRATVT